ncbi:MAG TPA: translocation/assembly module TamB domain-containing protein [Silvibacterium sp.]|nr:translocation/assembly module TamB domain-containing protein [Silvibacterium sp.]
MSAAANPNLSAPAPRRRHIFWRAILVIVVVLLVLLGGAAWYAGTPQFENYVRGKVIAALERTTGGRVQLGAFRWSVLHLEFTASDLTIHGLEGPGQVPYAHIDRLYIRVKIISLLRREIGLNYLEADHPVIHLIVYPDGSTNQPQPKVKSNNKPVINTIFDLRVNRAEVRNGIAIVNQQSTPFNAIANNLGVTVKYVPKIGSPRLDRYLAVIHLEDLSMQSGESPPLHSVLDAQVELGRNQVNLPSLRLQTGASRLDLSGSLTNFNDPAWKFQVNGGLDLHAVEALTGIPGLNRGQVQIDLTGNGSKSIFTVDGQSNVTGASYHAGSIHISNVTAETKLHITQDDLNLTGMRARFAQGGSIDGEMNVTQWMRPAPSTAVPPLPPKTAHAARKAQAVVARPEVQRGTIRAQLHGIALASVMAMVAPPHYTELGFDTEASGEARVKWSGSATAFVTSAKISLAPPLRPTSGRIPMYGTVDAQYSNVSGLVDIRGLDVHTPASQINVTGSLGVFPITRASRLQVNLNTASLAEFDRALTTLGVVSGGKQGVKALPASLHGNAQFTGKITDSILNPDVKGQLNATNLDTIFSTASKGKATPEEHSIHWDAVNASAEYSGRRISIAQAVLTNGPETVRVDGELDAHAIARQRYAFDNRSAIRANASIQNAAVQDLLAIAGEKLPVSGMLNLTAHANGTMDNLNGGGHLSLQGGTAYGEAYKSLNTDVRFAGREIQASNLVFLEDGGKVTGSGGYNLNSQSFNFTAQGSGFDFAHIKRLQSAKYTLGGALAFEAHGSGTLKSPSLQANLHLTRLNIDNAAGGFVNAELHTRGQILLMNVNANIANAQLEIHGQTQLAGDYQTQAQLTLSNLDVQPILTALNVQGVKAHSSIAAAVKVNGPLREPRKLSGDATVRQFAVTLAGIDLKSDGAIHATLIGGQVRLDPLHITGEDTDLRAQGSIGALTDAHNMNFQASGSIDLKLAQTFNRNLTASGRLDFKVNADGTFAQPGLTGDARFTDVSFALLTFPNGLSKMNGTLQFNQDRLDVKDLTAVSGGGKITLGGFITYQQGVYGDLTAIAKDVRIRYPQGMSTMVDAKLRLQGTQQSSLLSGNVTISRFLIGSDLDMAAFTSSSGGVSLPPNPNAPTNRVRLNIHILSAPQLDFQNSYAKLAGDVDLRVRGTIAQPAVLGHISITEGNATFAGTKYELQHGDIYFSNPVRINPTLDLSATAHVEDYDITIGLSGTASKPVPTFRSEPPLSEQDIFSLLALGRTQEEQQIYSNMEAQAGVNSTADALLGGALNATVSSRIQKLFGGGSVKIDPTFVSGTGNATARITVEQQVSKNATLTYATNVNSTAEQLIQAQVDLTQNLSVTAVRDETGVFSLIFKLRRRYR